jgi:hypothetical protein
VTPGLRDEVGVEREYRTLGLKDDRDSNGTKTLRRRVREGS